MHPVTETLKRRADEIGKEEITEWITIDQTHVDVFGAITGNLDPMHNDPERARELDLFGGTTVNYGLFTLALTTRFLKMIPNSLFYSNADAHTINYGVDGVRWPAPMYVGIPIRAKITLLGATEKRPNHFKMTYGFVVEQQGYDTPRMVATTYAMIVCTGGSFQDRAEQSALQASGR
ncbi:MaoC/PaaZ C-terminal domain-containing protein [Arthrobacter sp. STN4]|uniref:MaoC/PaaZ C-terminal domain-containing protein n=1 Tax=Arthrobacter sp. STN4 TaxID=2923276 RepID=UPI00211A3556|nr:MaoC/PaaZ C-terminal domain-containing protein [Arthrobacter sp. STN4]MCQ9165474.1 hypothetical protein [Arthrobacter sp. STN4]